MSHQVRFRELTEKLAPKLCQVAWGIVGSLLPSPPWPNFHASFKTTSLPRIRALAAIISRFEASSGINWETLKEKIQENNFKSVEMSLEFLSLFGFPNFFSCKKHQQNGLLCFLAAKHTPVITKTHNRSLNFSHEILKPSELGPRISQEGKYQLRLFDWTVKEWKSVASSEISRLLKGLG